MENKYSELEKLNQLKANGTITDTEFELQKRRILNNKSNRTKTKNKSKLLKGIIALVLIIIIIVVGIIVKEPISNHIMIQNTEKKLSQINAKDLESKIINELKNTSLNVNTTSLDTTFVTCDIDSKDSLNVAISILSSYYAPSEDFYDKFVFANISNSTEEKQSFLFPCFKIESDINGNVKNILYTCSDNYWISNDIIVKSIDKVLKEQYGITSLISVSYFKEKGNDTNHYKKSKFYYSIDKDFGASVISEITKDTDKNYIKGQLQENNATDISIFVWNIE